MFPKLSILCLTILSALALAGCDGSSSEPTAGMEPPPTDRPLKVGVVFDSGGRGDKSFNDSAYRGVERAQREFGIEIKSIESKAPKDYEGNLSALAEQGMDIVFAVGITQGDGLKAAATAHPNTRFAFIDGDLGMPNVKGLMFREEEGSFLAGYLAGLVSKTKKIGFVGGMNIPLIRKFEAGYIGGAMSAKRGIEVLPSKYTESWDDVGQGKAAARVLFSQGADIVYHAAGRCGLGVIDAAEEAGKGKFAIGVDSDQDDVKPGHVLTSMVKHVDQAVYDTIRDLKDGKWSAEPRTLDVASGGIGLTEFRFTKEAIGNENLDKVKAMQQQIAERKITVPSSMGELKAFVDGK